MYCVCENRLIFDSGVLSEAFEVHIDRQVESLGGLRRDKSQGLALSI